MKTDLINLVKYQQKDHGRHRHHHQKTQVQEIVHAMN